LQTLLHDEFSMKAHEVAFDAAGAFAIETSLGSRIVRLYAGGKASELTLQAAVDGGSGGWGQQ
jgi:hypothetical protein